MKLKSIKIILIIYLLIPISGQSNHDINIYDGFETTSLNKIWDTKKIIPGSVEIQSSIVRSGKSAAKITLRAGDQIDKEKGTILERTELLEKRILWAYEDLYYSYSFSLFIPQDFPIVWNRLVIAQWKQVCPIENCYPDNPVIAIRYISGELLITHKVSQQKKILYRTKEDIRNKWLDFKAKIRFSQKKDGEIKIWLNNELIVNYNGINAYPEKGGYPKRNHFKFKMGLYRDQMKESMTIYIDEYSKQLLSTNEKLK
jgi:hypothetical protein